MDSELDKRKMDAKLNRKKNNIECDRLSSLPDKLIHKIYSSISLKHVVQTSVLSSRWKFIWTSMPYLNFSSTEDFYNSRNFSNFVTNVLCRRNNMAEVFSVNLTFREKVINQVFIKKIMEYAFSHNIQQLNVECLLENDIAFPLSLFNSQSLKHLSLTKKCPGRSIHIFSITLISTCQLPDLTTLHLDQITLNDGDTDKFTGLMNLKTLTLQRCLLMGSNGFNICHSGLSNLIPEEVFGNAKFVNVVTPQLKNLSIRGLSKDIRISAPDLACLLFKMCNRYNCLKFSTDGFRCLEKVDITIIAPYMEDPHKIVDLLKLLQSVKFLTLNLELIELLSSYSHLISHRPSPFANLKSLKIYPAELHWEKQVNLSNEVKKYLLDSSPSATFTLISREEVIAQNIMAELWVLLKQELHEMNHLRIGESMEQIKSYWENLSLQIEQRKTNDCLIISKLQKIKGLLSNLTESRKAIIQPSFLSLCAEAESVKDKSTDCMKIQCDENQSRLSVRFHELLQQSS